MNHVDGRAVRSRLELSADIVIVGSGPAGSAAAREAVRHGASVVLIEAGRWFEPDEYPLAAFDAMGLLYRKMSASVVLGSAPIPFVQGKMVGGSSPINGAICWRLPRDVHQQWLRDDPALAAGLPWESIAEITGELETRLNVRPTDSGVAGRKNQLMARGADELGLEHRAIRRNVRGCQGLGRCMQGCPKGHKLSVDATLLADATAGGATVVSSVEVTALELAGSVANGVIGLSAGGAEVRVQAERAVIVAASAVQSPALLMRSGLYHGPVGRNFQCHPGVSMAGRFPEPVRMWDGATQGHEVIGLRQEGLKFEVLGFGLGVLAGRLNGVGNELSREIDDMAHQLDWGAAVKAEARGRVHLFRGRPVVRYSPTANDIARFRKGLRVLGEMMLAAGADHVSPGVRGFDRTTSSRSTLARLEERGPKSTRAYTCAITHMFGSCRMGSDPARSVVRPDFRHHTVDRLYIADSSVFPSNIGVNPQIPIMALATLCGRSAVGATSNDETRRENNTSGARPMRIQSDTTRELTLHDLMQMDGAALQRIMDRGHPLDPELLAGRQYLGVDLSLPDLMRKILWHTFRKTFVRDPGLGDVRGWNVKMEQHGIDGKRVPLLNRNGDPVTFGHYRVRSAAGIRFPKGWSGGHFLDYTIAGNSFADPAGLGFTPLVAVNAGSQDLLLGWEIFKIGPAFLPMPLYWALRYEGPLDRVVEPPRKVR